MAGHGKHPFCDSNPGIQFAGRGRGNGRKTSFSLTKAKVKVRIVRIVSRTTKTSVLIEVAMVLYKSLDPNAPFVKESIEI